MKSVLGLLLVAAGLAGCSSDNSPVSSGFNSKSDSQEILTTILYDPPSPFTRFGGVYIGPVFGKTGPGKHSQDSVTGVVRIICYDYDNTCFSYTEGIRPGQIRILEGGPPYDGTPDTTVATPQI